MAMLTNSQANAFVNTNPKVKAAWEAYRAANPNITGPEFNAWATQQWLASGKPAPSQGDLSITPEIKPGMFGLPQGPTPEPLQQQRERFEPVEQRANYELEQYLKQFDWYNDPLWNHRQGKDFGPGQFFTGEWSKGPEGRKDVYQLLMDKYGTTDRHEYLRQMGVPLDLTKGLSTNPERSQQYYDAVRQFIQANPSLAAPTPGMFTQNPPGGATTPPPTGPGTLTPPATSGGLLGGSGSPSGSFGGASNAGGAGMLNNQATWQRPQAYSGAPLPTVQDSSAWRAQYPTRTGLFS